jgi:rhodanese-related sulfurtransferase
MFNRLFGLGANTPEIPPAEAQRRLAAGALLVDVREADEWAEGHVPGRLAELPKDREILLICRSGNRSARATALLKRAGIDSAFNVAGGIGAWVRQGLPITRR